MMKFLCVCTYGHSRSVALARTLHHRGYAAIAVGWMTSGRWLDIACDNADTIFVMDDSAIQNINLDFRDKIDRACIVGHDQWSNPYNNDLLMLCENNLDKRKLFGNGKSMFPKVRRPNGSFLEN